MSSSVSMPKKLIGPVLGTRGMVPIGSCKFVCRLLVGPRLSPRSALPPHRGRLTPPARLLRTLSDHAGLPHSGPSSRTSAPACACLAGCRRAKSVAIGRIDKDQPYCEDLARWRMGRKKSGITKYRVEQRIRSGEIND
jgi:hypothetical protein